MSNAKTRWYVINGQLLEETCANLYEPEIVRVVKATCYEEVIDMFKRDFPTVTCVNTDRLSISTARSYKVVMWLEERTIVRPVES